MFEVRDEETGKVWAKRPNMGRAMESADVFHIGTKRHFVVVEVTAVYNTGDSSYTLRPTAEMAVAALDAGRGALTRLNGGLKEGYARFISLKDKLYGPAPAD